MSEVDASAVANISELHKVITVIEMAIDSNRNQ